MVLSTPNEPSLASRRPRGRLPDWPTANRPTARRVQFSVTYSQWLAGGPGDSDLTSKPSDFIDSIDRFTHGV